MTTLQSCILALLFMLCACLVPAASFSLFFGCAVVSLTWAMYSILSVKGYAVLTPEGIVIVWGA